MVLLGLLGVAVGATITDPVGQDTPSARAMGIGAGLWWIVSGILALLAGGWATGRLAGLRRRWEAPLHGLVTWAITATAMLFLMGSALGSVVSGAFRLVDSGARLIDRGALTDGDRRAFRDLDGRHRGDDRRGDRRDRRDRDEAAAADAADQPALTPADEQKAREAAQAATDAVAAAAWCTFAFLLLSAAAAALGALAGAPHRKVMTPTVPTTTVRTAPTLPGT